MLKQLFIATVIGTMFSGCIASPYDDYPRGQYHDKQAHKMRGEGRDKNAYQRDWNRSDRRYAQHQGDYRR